MPPKQQPKNPLPKAQPKALPKAAAKQPVRQPAKPVPRTSNAATKKAPQQPQGQTWIARYTNAAAAGVNNFTGGIVNAVGNGVAGAGKGAGTSITTTSRTWGDAVREYGNSIKDATGASGPRGGTNKNPLGLASTGAGARAIMSGTPGPTPRKGTAANPLGL